MLHRDAIRTIAQGMKKADFPSAAIGQAGQVYLALMMHTTDPNRTIIFYWGKTPTSKWMNEAIGNALKVGFDVYVIECESGYYKHSPSLDYQWESLGEFLQHPKDCRWGGQVSVHHLSVYVPKPMENFEF